MKSSKVRLLSAAIIGLGAVLALFSFVAPLLGAGTGDDFVLWRIAGLSRGSVARAGGTLMVAGLAIALAGFRRHLFPPAHTLVSASRPAISWLHAQLVFLSRLWHTINRDWGATLLLLPFATYIVVFMVTVPPGQPWIAPDSMTYIGFSPTRTLLYPTLLRLLAAISDDPRILSVPFLIAGIAATIALAEAAQRLFRNILISVPAALGLFFCWPLLEHAGFVLSDYPFYAAYTATLAAALVAFRSPSPASLICVGVLIGLSIAIRPVGIILFAVPFFLFFAHPGLWRRQALFLVLPVAITLLTQAAAHQMVFGYFGISRFSGYPWAGNTALMMNADTPTPHVELRDEIVDMARPFLAEINAAQTAQDRYIALINTANPLIGNTGSLAMSYGKRKGILQNSDTSTQMALVRWMNGLSTLNAGLGALPAQTFAQSIWQDGFLLTLGQQAHKANLGDFISLTALKLRFSWQSVLPWYGIGPDFSSHRSLVPGRSDLGMSERVTAPPLHRIPGADLSGFNAFVERFQSLARLIPVPLVVLATALAGLAANALYLARRRRVPPAFAAVAMLGATTILYHLMMCIAQIPIGRFLVVVAAGPALLLFLPLAGLSGLIGAFSDHRT